jgi:hypothetical protein
MTRRVDPEFQFAEEHRRGFDMGGAVPADARDDPRVGISDFKRRFSKEMVAVGAEWEFEPHPARAAVARWLSDAATRIRRR